MRILGIEASGLVASTALWEDGVILAEYTINNRLTHSQTLLPMIEAMLRTSGEPLEKTSAIAVSRGPGSFTGLRIGAATGKGLALALDIPVIGVSSLKALAENERDAEDVIVPIMDARRGQVYCYAELLGQELLEEQAMAVENLVALLSEEILQSCPGKSVLFLGDGVPVYRERILALADFPCRFAAANQQRQRGASVAQLGARLYESWLREKELSPEQVKEMGADRISEAGLFTDTVMNSDELVPVYLRKPQAEQERDAGLLEDPGQKSLRKIARGDK